MNGLFQRGDVFLLVPDLPQNLHSDTQAELKEKTHFLRVSAYLGQLHLQQSLGLHQFLTAPAEGLFHSGALDPQILCGVLQDALCQSPDAKQTPSEPHLQKHVNPPF